MKLSCRTNTFSIKYDVIQNYFPKKDLTPLWIADMDFETPEPIREALKKAIDFGALGYNHIPDNYFPAIMDWIKNVQGYHVEREWLTFIPGIVKGIGYVINYFTNIGDGIVVQPPIYPPFINLPKGNNREVFFNPLIRTSNGYEMDFDSLRSLLENNKNIKVLLLANPHNPAGVIWSKETLAELAEICAEFKVLVVADEIHADMPLWGNKHIPFASVSQTAANVSITFGSPSKPFNIAGLVSSYAFIPNSEIRDGFYNWLTVNELNSPTIFATLGVMAAFNSCNDWRLEMLNYIEQNILLVKDFCEANFGELIVPVIPDASFLVWLDCRCLQSLLLEKTGQPLSDFFVYNVSVAFNDGEAFGIEGKGYVRMNVGTSRDLVLEVLNRINIEIKKL